MTVIQCYACVLIYMHFMPNPNQAMNVWFFEILWKQFLKILIKMAGRILVQNQLKIAKNKGIHLSSALIGTVTYYSFRLDLFRALSDHGKNLLDFEEETGPFLLQWMPDVISYGRWVRMKFSWLILFDHLFFFIIWSIYQSNWLIDKSGNSSINWSIDDRLFDQSSDQSPNHVTNHTVNWWNDHSIKQILGRCKTLVQSITGQLCRLSCHYVMVTLSQQHYELSSLIQSLVKRRWAPLDALKSVPTQFTIFHLVLWRISHNCRHVAWCSRIEACYWSLTMSKFILSLLLLCCPNPENDTSYSIVCDVNRF